MRWNCTVDDIDHPVAREVFSYWDGKRRGGRLPARADIDPLDLKTALGNLLLIEVHQPGPRFRYRLVGTKLAAHGGFDPTGLFVEELPWPEYRAIILERLNALLERREPVYLHRAAVLDGRNFDYRMLWLPLAADGNIIDMMLGCQLFQERPAAG